MISASFRRCVALGVAAITLAGCDALLVPPAAAPTALAVRYSFAAANPARAFDKADNALVVVEIPGQETVQESFTFPAGQSEIRVRVALNILEEQAAAAVTLQLRSGTQTLFTGSRTLTLTGGEVNEADVALTPVAATLAVPQAITINALNQPVQLHGFALFATGDTVGPATITWTTTAPELQITTDGRLTATQNGTYVLNASSGGLNATSQVQVAAPAGTVAFTGPPVGSAFPGDSLIPPGVRVTDANGIALRGIVVTFTADNTGSVRVATVTTNAQGLAHQPAWLLGNTGVNTLTATVPGLAPVSVTVTPLNPCLREPTLAVPSVTNGVIVVGRDCQPTPGGRVSDRYRFSIAAPTVVRATLQSGAFAPFVVTGVPGTPSGYQIAGRVLQTPGTITSENVLPAGNYFVNPQPNPVNVGGAYTLTLSTGTEPQLDCAVRTGDAAVTWGSVAQANLTTGDCIDEVDTSVARRYDGYVILLRPNESVTVTLTANFPYRFPRWQGGNFVEMHDNVPAGQTRSFTVTAQVQTFYAFYVIGQHATTTGSYTMTFTGGPNTQTNDDVQVLSAPARNQND